MCVAGDGHCSGWYASYWNAFFFSIDSLRIAKMRTKYNLRVHSLDVNYCMDHSLSDVLYCTKSLFTLVIY